MDSINKNKNYKAIRKVLWFVLIANLTITIIKIVLGIATGALAIVSDGFHSMVDSSSNLIGLTAIRLAAKPPDERYPYGYRRYETIGALAIGGLLLAAAWEIVQSIGDRIINGAHPEVTLTAFILMVLTLPVNIGVVILEKRAGKRLNSEILLADATHTQTDLYVTASVIASLIGIRAGLGWLDLVVASIVVVLIIRASIGILRDASGSLADIVGVNPNRIEEISYDVPGVRYIHNIRSRGTSDAIFIDLHVKVNPAMSTSQAHAVATEVENRLKNEMKNVADAIVHIEPARINNSNAWEQISYGLRQIADGMGLGLHDLHVHVNRDGEHDIELHLEMSGDKTLRVAHQLADDFEKRVKSYWPQAARIITHLEPLRESVIIPAENIDEKLESSVLNFLKSYFDSLKVQGVRSQNVDEHTSIIVKLAMPADISLFESHTEVEKIKREMLMRFPEISRAVVHVEPINP
jgi:cation diffusion facilitator family transporter